MNGDPWTIEADQELRQWFANGRSNKEMAELTGRTEDAITQHKHRLGLRGGSATCQRSGCGLPLIRKNGRPGNYCSQVCSTWPLYEVTVGHKSPVEVKGVCAYCKKPFARTKKPTGPRGLTAASAYCSRDCDKAAWYLREKAKPGGREFMAVRNERSRARWKRLKEARNVQ